jgi:hypothetical protein
MYRIGYVNANSLPDGKFAQAIGLLESSFDCLFIAEHWYQHHESRLSHPLVISSTKLDHLEHSKHRSGRHHGGIYLLAQQRFRSLIQHTVSNKYSITVSLPGMRIASVYLPPYSLPDASVPFELNAIGPVDLLLGDLNCRFHCTTTANRPPPSLSIRSQHIHSWAVDHGMDHMSDDSTHTRVDNIPDHAFSGQHIPPLMQLSFFLQNNFPFKQITSTSYWSNVIPCPDPCKQIPRVVWTVLQLNKQHDIKSKNYRSLSRIPVSAIVEGIREIQQLVWAF